MLQSTAPDTKTVAQALGRFIGWIDTVRGDGGYYGPVVGVRNTAMLYCGQGFDWRYEGLLDGMCDLYRATKDTAWLDRIAGDLADIRAAQLLDGSFRNSYFEFNPCEAGMPHEPAMLAAACRAWRVLRDAGHSSASNDLLDTVARYVDGYLIKQLWSKQLQTFNDWPTSEFQYFTPHAVAAAIELLIVFSELADRAKDYDHYLRGAADSIVGAQITEGPLAGGIPPSARDRAVSPFYAARCLPGLTIAAKRLGDEKCQIAARHLSDFAQAQLNAPAGLARLVYTDRPPSLFPRLTGALAGTIVALRRAGVDFDPGKAVTALCAQQMPSGAFETASGFGTTRGRGRVPDWRDLLPVCGWQDKIFALLAATGVVPETGARSETVCRDVLVRGRRAKYAEDAESIRIEDAKGHVLLTWKKRCKWPEVCLL